MKKAAAFFISVVLVLTMLSSVVFADENYVTEIMAEIDVEAVEETESITEVVLDTIIVDEETAVVEPDEVGDNNELLMAYMEISASTSNAPMYSFNGLRKLTGINAQVYGLIRTCAKKVANGEETSTIFNFSMSDLGLDGHYSAADLGVDAVVENNTITPESQDALAAKLQDINLNRVITALLFDCPAEFYWYEKSVGCNMQSSLSMGAEYDSSLGEYVLYFSDDAYVAFSFTVAEDYAVDNASGTYVVDSSVIDSIQTALAFAQEIISTHANENDYQKLVSYKEAICDEVTYNSDAGNDNYTYDYGNPWQLIWVFDEDETTDVVCEGYSKAFQFLCDGSEFDSDKIQSRLVTGTMEGGTGAGRHMWNIVTMDDGLNYLVDVTNCDVGTIGAPDQLFLANYKLGTVSTGYAFDCFGGDIHYFYDEDTLSTYDELELTICSSSYIPKKDAPYHDGYVGDNYYEYFIEGDYQYTIINMYGEEYLFIVAYLGNETNVIVPAVINGKSVYGCGYYAFTINGSQIERIEFEEGIQHMTGSLYELDKLTEVKIPTSMDCLGHVPWEAKLNGQYPVWFPNGGGEIPVYCPNVETIIVADGSEYLTVYEGVLFNKNMDTLVYYPSAKTDSSYQVPANVKTIGESAFNCSQFLTEIELPESLELISAFAFQWSAIEEIDIPANVQKISRGAFNSCTQLRFVRFLDTSSLRTIEGEAFEYCTSLEYVDDIPFKCTFMGTGLFDGCTNLNAITMKSNPIETFYNQDVFYGANLDVYYPSTIDWIEDLDLIKKNLGNNVNFIPYEPEPIIVQWTCGEFLFTLDILTGSLKGEGDYIPALSQAEIWKLPDEVELPEECDNNRNMLWFVREIIIPSSLESLEEYPFYSIEKLRRITIPAEVTNIEPDVFYGCPNLKNVYYGGTIADWFEITGVSENENLSQIILHDIEGHVWDKQEITTQPTCTEAGLLTYTCSDCGEAFEKIIPPSHTWDKGVVTVEPTCEENGIIMYTCQYCGETELKEIPSIGHYYIETSVTTPNCTEPGVRTFICRNDSSHIYSEEIPALGHNWGEWYVITAATEEEEGLEGRDCLNDPSHTETRAIPKLMHTHNLWRMVAKEATCTVEGNSEYWTCSGCGRYFSDENGTEEIEKDSWIIPKKEHTPVVISGKAATCTETGLTEGSKCSVCGEILQAQETIPAKGHSYGAWVITKEATCTTAGSREKVCGVCNDKVTETIPAKGHIWEAEYRVDKEATCTEAGSESQHCAVCDAIDETTIRGIPAKGHSYGDWVVTKEATCTEAGSKEKVCSACGDKVTETLSALGHVWNEEYTVDKAATCSEEGRRSIHCSVCDGIKDGSVETIEKLPHTYGAWGVTKEPTCTEAGAQEKTCADCGDKVIETIPATGHDMSKTAAKAATFTEDGNTEYWYCSNCRKYFSDEDGQNEIEENSWIIPKKQDRYNHYTGIVNDEGTLIYLTDGLPDTSVSGIYKYTNIWCYVKNGVVDPTLDSVEQNANGWWCIHDGKVDFSYTGFERNANGWWYCENGQVKFNKNDILKGIANNDPTKAGVDGWWYVKGSQVINTSTVASNANGWWYVKDGKVAFDYTGVQRNDNGWWYIKGGQVDFNYNGFGANEYGWWYCENGQVKFNKNDILKGIANNDPTKAGVDGWWYVKGSQVIKTNIVASNAYGWWFIHDGRVDFGYTGVQNNSNGWWYIKDGKVDFNYTGFGTNEHGWWYCENGQVKFNKNDIISGKANSDPNAGAESGWWNVKGSQVVKGPSVEQNANGWWYIDESGKVDFNYNGVGPNAYGEWYIKNGQVDFKFSGNAYGHQFKDGKLVG